MKRLKLLMEILKHSTRAKIIACSVGIGVLAIGGVVTYCVVAKNDNAISDNKKKQK